MVRKILIVSLLFFATLGFSASEYDKDITVLNQSRNDKVVAVFKEMMKAYEEGDISGFFSYVSEDRFIQDYMTFYDAIEKDMRIYDILNVDTWVDKITQDGIKRYLYVTWQKRYQSTSSDNELFKKGYSRFLFDEVNGKYKLIGLAGNNFWGGSLAEWREEVPEIAGQEHYDTAPSLPDLIVENITCPSGAGGAMPVEFDISNIGTGDTTSGSVEYGYSGGMYPSQPQYNGDIPSGGSVHISTSGDCYGGETATVDPNNLIKESNENNNIATNGSPL
ncbi:MAG: CARDB domain-containing protein [Sulfurospirillum sp.]